MGSNYEQTKAFIKSSGFACFTVGILLFGDPSHLSWVAFIFKGGASIIAGFLTGFVNKLGGIVAENLKEKYNAKHKKGRNKKAA